MTDKRSVLTVLAAAIVAAISSPVCADQPPPAKGNEAELIAVLEKPDAPLYDKAKACQALAVIGTKRSVPALAALLGDEKTAHYARFGLETIPDPAVDEALRSALGKVQGKLLVGVIDSVANRRDAGAVLPPTATAGTPAAATGKPPRGYDEAVLLIRARDSDNNIPWRAFVPK